MSVADGLAHAAEQAVARSLFEPPARQDVSPGEQGTPAQAAPGRREERYPQPYTVYASLGSVAEGMGEYFITIFPAGRTHSAPALTAASSVSHLGWASGCGREATRKNSSTIYTRRQAA